MYGNRNDPKYGKKAKTQKLYAVYDPNPATDELLAFGTAAECAEILGMKNVPSFYETVYRTVKGTNKKYIIVVLNDEEEDDNDAD